jgi:hypothetical protein
MKIRLVCFVVTAFVLLTGLAQASNGDVRFEGTIIKFPTAEGMLDRDLSGVRFDLRAVPPEAQCMVGKVYRGQHVKNARNKSLGAIWYVFLTEWNQQAVFYISQFASGYGSTVYKVFCPANILNNDEFLCRSGGTNNWRFYIRKERPTFLRNDGYELELEEVATLPQEILSSRIAPKKSPEKMKIEDGIISFPETDVPRVITKDLKLSFPADSPERIRLIQGKIYRFFSENTGQATYLIPLGYDQGTKVIRFLFITNNKGTRFQPARMTIEGIYSESAEIALKPIGIKNDNPWAQLRMVPKDKGLELQLLWPSGSQSDLSFFAELFT